MYSFTKQQRLLKSSEFQAVQKTRLSASSAQLLLLAKPNVLGHARLGLVISKKFAKLAVERNQIKRIVRESFRLNASHIPPIDIVVLSRKGITQLNKEQLRTCFDELLMQLVKRAEKQLLAS